MTVFIACAEADRPVAEMLEKFLERRGLFVEIETGVRGFRHVQHGDTVVALWSKDTMFSPQRLVIEKRTMEAWADEQLVLVKLDHAFSPVGLRDLQSIDASFDKQRDIAWAAVAKRAHDQMTRPRAPAPAPQAEAGARPEPTSIEEVGADEDVLRRMPAPEPAKSASVNWLIPFFLLMVLLVLGAGAYWAYVSGLSLRIEPPLPAQYQPWLPAIGAGVALLLMGVVALFAFAGRSRKKPKGASSANPSGSTVFVSYSHADNTAVLPVVEAVQAQGRNVWIDKQGISGGENWAGEIVRAIKGATGVIVMCSKQAFESDHVKREVYLADRYKKPMVPIFLESAAPPEDFEYFFAGVQWLELYKTPQADRSAALAKALKAV